MLSLHCYLTDFKQVLKELPLFEAVNNNNVLKILLGGLFPDKGFVFKKECTTFHIFLRLLGNVYLRPIICRDFLTWKRNNFKFVPFIRWLANLALFGVFISHFFISVVWIETFFNFALVAVAINALILLYLVVVTVKAARMINESNVPIGCCKGCDKESNQHHYGEFWNNNKPERKCDQGHDETLPMVISCEDVKCN